jgi:RNA polymerase sigma factor (sigma-70 family)
MDELRSRFEAQVLPHLDAAYRFARWLTRTPTDAEDIVQDAILRAFRSFGSLRGSDVKSWLLVIVKNCHFTAAKQQQQRATVALPDEGDVQDGDAMMSRMPGPEGAALLLDEGKTLDRLLSSLPEEQRTVLWLREIEELDYAQIAAVTGVPIGTVMSRLARSRAALKVRWLQEAEDGPRAMR